MVLVFSCLKAFKIKQRLNENLLAKVQFQKGPREFYKLEMNLSGFNRLWQVKMFISLKIFQLAMLDFCPPI